MRLPTGSPSHCIASTIPLALDGASGHPPSFFSLSSVSLFSASFSYSSLSHLRRKSKFFVCGEKNPSEFVANRVGPRHRRLGGPGTCGERRLPRAHREAEVASGPQPERPPRFHSAPGPTGPQNRTEVSGSQSGAVYSALRNPLIPSTRCNPASTHNTYPTAGRHLHREVNGKPESVVKGDLEAVKQTSPPIS